jgi:hypothetical protein
LGGCTPYMIAQTLAASLTAFVLGVNVEQIRAALHSFQVSPWQTPQQTTDQMVLFNPNYYQFDVLGVYSDFKDEIIPPPELLSSQAVSTRSSNVVASTIALENWRQRENQHPVSPLVDPSTITASLSKERKESPTPVTNHKEPVPHTNHAAPILMQVALNVAQKVVKQTLDMGEIVGTVAIAFSSVAAEMALKAGKKWGTIAWTKFRKQYS